MVKQQQLLSIATVYLFITTLIITLATVSAAASGQQTRPTEKSFSSETLSNIHGHRPTTSILPVKSLNLHHHRNGDASSDSKKNEFYRLNKVKERRPMTRAGLHDAVIHATRQSSGIVVMGATSWN